jgi:hypothetical protein
MVWSYCRVCHGCGYFIFMAFIVRKTDNCRNIPGEIGVRVYSSHLPGVQNMIFVHIVGFPITGRRAHAISGTDAADARCRQSFIVPGV